MQITIAKISDQLNEKKKDYENLEIKIKKVKIEIDKKNEEYKMLEEEINKLKIDIIVYESTFKIVTQEQSQELAQEQTQELAQVQEQKQEQVHIHVQELTQTQAQIQEQVQELAQTQAQAQAQAQAQEQVHVVVVNKRKNNLLEREEDSNIFKRHKLCILPVFTVHTNPSKDTPRFLREVSAALGAIDKPNRHVVTKSDNFGFFSTSHSKVYVIGVKDNNEWTTDVENTSDECKIIWGNSYMYKKNEEMDDIKMNLKNIMVNYKYHNNVKHNLTVMLIANSININHTYDIKLYTWLHE